MLIHNPLTLNQPATNPVPSPTAMAVDDVMEICVDTAMSDNVIANDIFDESAQLTLTVIVTDGEHGSCTISGK